MNYFQNSFFFFFFGNSGENKVLKKQRYIVLDHRQLPRFRQHKGMRSKDRKKGKDHNVLKKNEGGKNTKAESYCISFESLYLSTKIKPPSCILLMTKENIIPMES